MRGLARGGVRTWKWERPQAAAASPTKPTSEQRKGAAEPVQVQTWRHTRREVVRGGCAIACPTMGSVRNCLSWTTATAGSGYVVRRERWASPLGASGTRGRSRGASVAYQHWSARDVEVGLGVAELLSQAKVDDIDFPVSQYPSRSCRA